MIQIIIFRFPLKVEVLAREWLLVQLEPCAADDRRIFGRQRKVRKTQGQEGQVRIRSIIMFTLAYWS